MAQLTLTADGSNTLTTTTQFPVNGIRNYVIVNNSNAAVVLTLTGVTAAGAVSWRKEDATSHGTSVDNVNLGQTYVVDKNSHVRLVARNLHTAGQQMTITGRAKHNLASSVGDTVFIATESQVVADTIN